MVRKSRFDLHSSGEKNRGRVAGRAKGAASGPPRGRPRRPNAAVKARRRQILAAALSIFSQRGFEAARLEDIALQAKVGKGTLYLYFPDKQAMFEALVHDAAEPVLADLSALSKQVNLPADALLKRIFDLFRTEILGTERKLIIRLILAEGSRFPDIARFYYREVISRVMRVLRDAAERANAKGELATDAPARFPQLIAAPLLLSIVWEALFERVEHLDVHGMLTAYAELLTVAGRDRP